MHLPTTVCVAALLASTAPAFAATFLVSTAGPYTTIQAAVDAASDGDTVLISDGVWSGSGNRDIDLDGRTLTIGSASGDPGFCIVDCGHAARFIRLDALEIGCVLSDFTILNGSAGDGGGVLLAQNANATLRNLRLFSCHATAEGGTVRLMSGATVLIEGCEFVANHADEHGGGLALGSAEAMVTGSSFFDNTAEDYGGGAVHARLGVGDPSRLTLVGCHLQGNEASVGGAILAEQTEVLRLEACTFSQNTVGYAGGALAVSLADAELIDCTFIENEAGSYGGAVHLYASATRFDGGTLRGNHAYGGGAIYVNGSDVTARRVMFAQNTVSNSASAAKLVGASSGRLDNCRFLGNGGSAALVINSASAVACSNTLFSGNLGEYAGAIKVIGLLTLTNSTVAGNQCSQPLGAGVLVRPDAIAQVANCILWNNTGDRGPDSLSQIGGDGSMLVDSSCVQNFEPMHYAGSGNIDANPLLVDPLGPDGVAGTEDDDCRLGPGSPAIDAGDNALLPADGLDCDDDGDTSEAVPFDLDDTDRIENGTTDMGAYERASTAVPGDLDGSGAVEVTDLVMLITNWGGSGPGADLAAPYDVITVDDLVQLFLLWS